MGSRPSVFHRLSAVCGFTFLIIGLLFGVVPATAGNSIGDLIQKARACRKGNQPDSVVVLMRQALTQTADRPATADSTRFMLYELLGWGLYRQGNDAASDSVWALARKIPSGPAGPGDSLQACLFSDFGYWYKKNRVLDTAEVSFTTALDLRRKAFGPEHALVAVSMADLASVYQAANRLTDAAELYEKALTLQTKVSGPENPLVADIQMELGIVYYYMSKFPDAERVLLQAIQIRAQAFGPNSVEVARALNRLVVVYYGMEKLTEADSLGQRAVAIMEKTYGSDSPEICKSVAALGNIYLAQGRFFKAESLYIRVIGIEENAYGPDDLEVAHSLGNLGAIYNKTARYAEAETIYRRSIAILEKKLGPDHPEVSTSLYGLAAIYTEQGRYQEAEPLFKRALTSFDKTYGTGSMYSASVLYNLALIYHIQGHYLQAEETMKRSLKIFSDIQGADSPAAADASNILALIYRDMGRNAEAEELMRRALTISEKTLGLDHPQVALIMTNLANQYDRMGQYADAEKMHARALAIREKAFGPDNLFVLKSRMNLANAYFGEGRYAEADSIYERAASQVEKQLGPVHPDVATTLGGLATCQFAEGKYHSAESLFQRAETIEEKIYGPDHPEMTTTMLELARLYGSCRQWGKCRDQYRRFLTSRRRFIDHMLDLSSEEQKLRWVRQYPLIDNSLISLALTQRSDSTQALAAEMIVAGKAVVSDAVMKENQTAYCQQDQNLREDLRLRADVCSRISELALMNPADSISFSYRDSLKNLCDLQDSLSAQLSRRCAGFRDDRALRTTTLRTIREAIPPDAVLWEFVQYTPYTFGVPLERGPKSGAPRYLALIIGRSGVIDFVDIGSVSEIDSLITQARRLIYSGDGALYQSRLAEMEKSLQTVTARLAAMVCEPLMKHLGKRTEIIISPDGMLALMPFEILPLADGTYLIEKYRLSYVASGRDIVRFRTVGQDGSAAVVMADPDFDSGSRPSPVATHDSTSTTTASFSAPELQRGAVGCVGSGFAPLRYTRAEASAVAATLRTGGRFSVQEYFGAEASEHGLKTMPAPPAVLHLATHGYFCPLTDSSRAGILDNPLLRSGIALAGANRILSDHPDKDSDDEDGILTAFEVSGLNLIGTQLATLSVCESGVGDAITGEGVSGLRRAFLHAGVQSIVASLWRIPDKETADLMKSFYTYWLSGMNKRDALRQAQLDILGRCRTERKSGYPFFWGGFILAGNPY